MTCAPYILSLSIRRGPIFAPPHASKKDAKNDNLPTNFPCNIIRAIFLCVMKEF